MNENENINNGLANSKRKTKKKAHINVARWQRAA
jgi:hypothetical protein